jgi:hypothetical protein
LVGGGRGSVSGLAFSEHCLTSCMSLITGDSLVLITHIHTNYNNNKCRAKDLSTTYI